MRCIAALLVTGACSIAGPSLAEEGHFPANVAPCEMFLLDPARNDYGCDCTSGEPSGRFIARDVLGFHFPIARPNSFQYPIFQDSTFGTAFDIRCLRIPDYPYREGEAAVGVYLVGRDEWSLMFEEVRHNDPEEWQRIVEELGREPTIAPPLPPVLWSRLATESIVGHIGFDPPSPSPAELDSLSGLVETAEVEIPLDLAMPVYQAWLAWMATARQRFTQEGLDTPDGRFWPWRPLRGTSYYVRGDHHSILPLYATSLGPSDIPPTSIFYELVDGLLALSRNPDDADLESSVREIAGRLRDVVTRQ